MLFDFSQLLCNAAYTHIASTGIAGVARRMTGVEQVSGVVDAGELTEHAG